MRDRTLLWYDVTSTSETTSQYTIEHHTVQIFHRSQNLLDELNNRFRNRVNDASSVHQLIYDFKEQNITTQRVVHNLMGLRLRIVGQRLLPGIDWHTWYWFWLEHFIGFTTVLTLSIQKRSVTDFVTIVARRVSLVEQKLPTLPEHWVHPNFRGVKVTRSLIFYVAFSKSLFVLFLLVIVLSVLQSTASDYAFGILKLFCYYTTTIVKLLNDKQRKNNP